MKIYKLVNVLGALSDTGKLASDMYELGKKRYYSNSLEQEIPVSEMDFQHMVRAFVKQNDEDVRTDTQEGKVRELTNLVESLKEDIEVYKTRLATIEGIIEEKDEQLMKATSTNLQKEIKSKEYWRDLYHDAMQFGGARYVFSEIPNDDYGKKLTRGMKVFLNNDSYTMRVRGQHIKPELKGTGATYHGQSIEQSTHLRVYIDKK